MRRLTVRLIFIDKIMLSPNILILGLGNILLADEGFGPAAIYYLQNNFIWPDNIRLVDGGTRGLMLMAELMECEEAIILDIMLAGQKPGSLYFVDNENIKPEFSHHQSMHQSGFFDLLLNCELAGYRPRASLFAIEPFNYQILQPAITGQAQKCLPQFCLNVVNYIRQTYNLFIEEKQAEA